MSDDSTNGRESSDDSIERSQQSQDEDKGSTISSVSECDEDQVEIGSSSPSVPRGAHASAPLATLDNPSSGSTPSLSLSSV